MIGTPPARPRSITALAVLLFAVTLGGIVLTILFGGFFEIGVPRYLVVCVGVGYSMSAFASAVGLWRMAAWSVKVFGLWCVFAVALCMLMTASAGSPWSQVLVIALAALLGVAALAVYVSRQLGRSDPKASWDKCKIDGNSWPGSIKLWKRAFPARKVGRGKVGH